MSVAARHILEEGLPHRFHRHAVAASAMRAGVAAILLAIFALVLAGSAVSDFIAAALTRQHVGLSALGGIGYVVVSIAVFDVSKYLFSIRDPNEVRDYVEQVQTTDPNSHALVNGLNAEKLIPDIRQRVARRNK